MCDERITGIPTPNECKKCVFSAFKQFQPKWTPVTEQLPDSIGFPKPIGTLTIHNGFTVAIYKKLPNRFHRWMAKILLGWTYTKSREETKDAKVR